LWWLVEVQAVLHTVEVEVLVVIAQALLCQLLLVNPIQLLLALAGLVLHGMVHQTTVMTQYFRQLLLLAVETETLVMAVPVAVEIILRLHQVVLVTHQAQSHLREIMAVLV
jgi:hypothetical protein